jgi:hypothetical protein
MRGASYSMSASGSDSVPDGRCKRAQRNPPVKSDPAGGDDASSRNSYADRDVEVLAERSTKRAEGRPPV